MKIELEDSVAESLWWCLKYYELDNLSPSDEQAIIAAIENAKPELKDKTDLKKC